jgi:hypothetical protein
VLVSAAVWPSGATAPGFNSILRGKSSAAAATPALKLSKIRLSGRVVHRDMVLSPSGSAPFQGIRNQKSEVRKFGLQISGF